jgi:site-specific recombinase XerD
MTTLAPVLQAFFTDRLIAQRRASPHTIAGYRDTFRLLVRFATSTTGKTPSAMDIADLDAPLITAFFDHLEVDQHNTVRTRNWRLAAIHSLFGYAALSHPEHAATIQRVLAIPTKRHDRRAVTWLTDAEDDALLTAPDRGTWAGRRDHAMLVLAVQTGLRISELIGLSRGDVVLERGAHARCLGKGRKERATPLTRLTVAVLREWLAERGGQPSDPLFPPQRDTTQPRRHRRPPRRPPRRRPHPLPIVAHQARHHAHPPAHRRHAPPPRRHRHRRHRALARARAARHRPHLPARRHEPEGEGHRPRHAPRHRGGPLPARGPAARVPRQPLIIPTYARQIALPTRQIRAHLGTTTTSEQSAFLRTSIDPASRPNRAISTPSNPAVRAPGAARLRPSRRAR